MGIWRFSAENAKVTHILSKKRIKTGQMVANIRLQTNHFYSIRSSDGQGEKRCSSMSAIVEIYENSNISAELIEGICVGDKIKLAEGTMEKVEFEKEGVTMHKTKYTVLSLEGKYTPEAVNSVNSDGNNNTAGNTRTANNSGNSSADSGKKFNVVVEETRGNILKIAGEWYKITPKTKGVRDVNSGTKVNVYYAQYGNKKLLNAIYVVNA